MADKAQSSTVSVAPCPSVILPPRSSVESLFVNPSSASPGPMTLVSSLFSENYPGSACQSFSQLLAGMASPAAAGGGRTLSVDNSNAKELGEVGGGEKSLGLKQHRSMGLMVAHSPMFMIPAGLSPGALFNSPGMFSPLQSPFGMSHQQALAQVTAQAALMQSHIRVQARQQPSLPAGFEQTSTEHHLFNGNMSIVENKKSSNSSIPVDQSDLLRSERRAQSSSTTVDKPTDDGYNWRKYGQKQVKGSEYPRSYYKCTHPNCPVKKKVERSFDGGLTEIIYKGQHNHDQFLANKRIKDVSDLNVTTVNSQTKPKLHIINQTGDFNQTNEILRVHTQATPVQSTLCSDTEEEGGVETVTENANNDDEPDPKRRNTGNGASVSASSQKRVTESKIIVQTRSEVDYLDDGYRWRKYGQKIVKGNPNPRSYYKCTKEGCNVRKHVERASSDPKAVVTTYEGKHNHDIPTARSCRHAASVYAPPQNPNTMAVGKQTIIRQADAVKKEEGHDSHVAAIQLKEEQVSL